MQAALKRGFTVRLTSKKQCFLYSYSGHSAVLVGWVWLWVVPPRAFHQLNLFWTQVAACKLRK